MPQFLLTGMVWVLSIALLLASAMFWHGKKIQLKAKREHTERERWRERRKIKYYQHNFFLGYGVVNAFLADYKGGIFLYAKDRWEMVDRDRDEELWKESKKIIGLSSLSDRVIAEDLKKYHVPPLNKKWANAIL